MRFLLVDGMASFYRAYYSSSPKQLNNGLWKYLRILDNVYQEYPCDEIIICEDAPRSTLFRMKAYPNYKQNRKEPPVELRDQRRLLFGFLRKIGFPVVGLHGYEADDIIGTMSHRLVAEDPKCRVLIVSPDKDMFQLITSDRIGIVQHDNNTNQDRLLFRDDIHDIYGYRPEQTVDVKILSGDSSDNIPGLPHCGYKTALRMIKKYKSIDRILNKDLSADPKAEQFQKWMLKNTDKIEQARNLLTIRTDINPEPISQQLAYRVTPEIQRETLKKYINMDVDEFDQFSYASYIHNRLIQQEEE